MISNSDIMPIKIEKIRIAMKEKVTDSKGSVEISPRETLLQNLDKIHSTPLGIARIKSNLGLELEDVVKQIKKQLQLKNCSIERQGKNYYAEVNDICFTINASSFTIITAHSHYRRK